MCLHDANVAGMMILQHQSKGKSVSWAEEVRIETPEQIDFDFEMAGPGSRAAAQILDWIVKFFWLALGALATVLLGLMLDRSEFTRYLITGIMMLLGFIFFVGYDIYYEAYRQGQTPGKKYIGIRVIADDGGPLSMRGVMIRNFMNIADFLPVGYLIGGVLCLLNNRGQRLGDMAAGSLVVRDQEMVKVSAVIPVITSYTAPVAQFSREQLALFTMQDKHVLESYLQRFDTLDKEAKKRLTEKLYLLFTQKLNSDQPVQDLHETEERFDFLLGLHQSLQIVK
jgi:uncharacterized RDD family membrane protein YckC